MGKQAILREAASLWKIIHGFWISEVMVSSVDEARYAS